MKISVVIPSKGCHYLDYAVKSLREQVVKPHEVILVLKGCDVRKVERSSHGLNTVIIEQQRGFFTHALNMGKREARGDIVVFTDDDAIFPKGWIKRYVELHAKYRGMAGISSRDIYIDLDRAKLLPAPDDRPYVRLYRWFARLPLDRPHPLLKRYRLGVYVTRGYEIAHGPYIPCRTCYSLPFRGVNMSFKAEYIHDVWFPEHPKLVRAPGNEQYFGLQLALKGSDIIYVPQNPVMHIVRESLSRTTNRDELKVEIEIMRELMSKLFNKCRKHGLSL